MKLVNLAAFRRDNGMTQADIAYALKVTRAYVSRVETGRANLSDKKIDFLLDFEEQWEIAGLVPCYTRLLNLAKYLQANDSSFYDKLQKPPGLDDSYWFEYYVNRYPFYGILREETIKAIRHGRSEITEETADAIIGAFPKVNRLWLLQGEGQMMVDDTRHSVDQMKESFGQELTEMNKKIEQLIGEINSLHRSIDEMSSIIREAHNS